MQPALAGPSLSPSRSSRRLPMPVAVAPSTSSSFARLPADDFDDFVDDVTTRIRQSLGLPYERRPPILEHLDDTFAPPPLQQPCACSFRTCSSLKSSQRVNLPASTGEQPAAHRPPFSSLSCSLITSSCAISLSRPFSLSRTRSTRARCHLHRLIFSRPGRPRRRGLDHRRNAHRGKGHRKRGNSCRKRHRDIGHRGRGCRRGTQDHPTAFVSEEATDIRSEVSR